MRASALKLIRRYEYLSVILKPQEFCILAALFVFGWIKRLSFSTVIAQCLMNTIELILHILPKGSLLEKGGINFTNCAFLEANVDSVQDEDGIVVWDELLKSSHESGNYLIFTCECGIAGCGSFDYVPVKHENDRILWELPGAKLEFDKTDYLNKINKMKIEIDNLPANLKLEPTEVLYPEES